MTSESSEQEPEIRWPLNFDPIDRGLHDPSSAADTDWHPATPATRKLWRCFEAMQKIRFLLESMSGDKSESRKRRFLIQLAVPLVDFFKCIDDLTEAIEGDSQTRSHLSGEAIQKVRLLRIRFREAVLEGIQPLQTVRNKLGAHTDEKLEPAEASILVAALDLHKIAAWLHAGLIAVDQLANLECYAWTSVGYRSTETRLMNCEPFAVSFLSDEPHDLISIEVAASPKRHIRDAIVNVIELSTWMFADDQTRLIVTERIISPSKVCAQ